MDTWRLNQGAQKLDRIVFSFRHGVKRKGFRWKPSNKKYIKSFYTAYFVFSHCFLFYFPLCKCTNKNEAKSQKPKNVEKGATCQMYKDEY
jgi:hypothetical protein